MERDAINLGTHKVSTLFKKFFIPTLLGMISMSIVTVADGVFIGHGVGSDGIAAVNICIPLLMIFTGIGLMSGVGCSVVSSIHLARGKVKAARLNVTQAVLFVTIAALIPSILIVAFAGSTGLILGSSDRLLPLVKDYLMWFIPSLVFQMWISVGLFIIRLDGAPRTAMWCSMISAIANIFLDWLFIFPFGWGIMGAAFATSISIALGGIISISYLLWKAKTLKLLSPKFSIKSLRLSLRNIGYQCRIGSSALMGESTLAMLMFLGNQVFMTYLGDDGVGAFGIACYYAPFIFMVGNAIAQSAQPIISYNFGIKNHKRVVSTQRIALFTSILCGTIVTLAFIIFPQYLVGLFLPTDTAVAQIAISGFPYFAIGFIFFISNLAIIGYYQSIEKVKNATIYALLRGFILLTPAFLFLPSIMGNVGIWLAMPFSEISTLVIISIIYLTNRKLNTILH